MKLEELKKMTRDERLQAMEVLWDSMLHENEEIDTPEWHEKILKDREKIIMNGSAKFISIADLKASRGQ